jgi:RNA polymerase sigma-70 factor (ECF subfamily)
MALDADRRRRDRFERTVLPHLDAAYVLARWLMRNDADASDVVQEAFVRALRYFDTYRDGDAKSWLLKIVRHTSYSWHALNHPANAVSLEAEVKFGDSVAIPATNPEALLESRSDLRRVDKLIKALPARLREVIVLRELHELGYRQIAEVTEVPVGTVMSRLYRARSLLLRAYDAASAALPGLEAGPGQGSPEPKSSCGQGWAA